MATMNRRNFLTVSALSATPLLGARTWAAARGANDRIRVGVMGARSRGKAHITALLAQPGVEISHICDVDTQGIEAISQKIAKAQGKAPIFVQDARKILEDKTVDVLTIATPNHWHSLAAVWACQAGKDVYVEKPLSQTVLEGRKLIEAAKKYGRIVQHGTQNRSNESIRAAVEFMRAGKLGKVTLATAVDYKRRPGIGRHKGPGVIPSTVDYDLWLGPAAKKPLERIRLHYDWHWFWEYGSGDMGNQGVHQIDVAMWGLNKNGMPKTVNSAGGRFAYDDDGETANTQTAVFDYGDCRLICEMRNLDSKPLLGTRIGNIWYGSEGYIVRDLATGNTCKAYLGKSKEPMPLGEGKADLGTLERLHFANFLSAIRSRKADELRADAETGHFSSSLCHLANISHRLGKETPFGAKPPAFASDEAAEAFERQEAHLRDNKLAVPGTKYTLGQTLVVDAAGETLGDPQANALLTRSYRAPFTMPEKV